MERLNIYQNTLLMIMLLAIIVNVVVFHLFQSHNGFFYISFIGFYLTVVYATDWLGNRIHRNLLFILLSLVLLYSIYLLFSKDITELIQTPSLFLASVSLLLFFF